MLTQAQLLEIAKPVRKADVDKYLTPLNAAMVEFGIDTPLRQAAFLAQLLHESGRLMYVKELASGKAYEGRRDLGNDVPGYGVKYKGRGLIQLTGYNNYVALMMALDIDCVNHPEILEEPINACRSAGWFWATNNLSRYADSGDFLTLTKRINGGTNGLKDRQELYARACKVLGV